MLITLYIILLINCLVNAFVRRSKGALFTPNIKLLFQGIHYIVLITLIIIAGINYSWIHILYMLLADFFAYFPFGYICNKIIK